MNKPFLLYRGPVASVSGYGAHSRDILQGLYESKLFDIKIDSCLWGSTPLTALNDDNLFHLWIKSNTTNQLLRTPDFYLQVTVPDEFRRIGKFNVGITAGIETTVIPKNWVIGANDMDLVIVPSNFSKSVMTLSEYDDIHPKKIKTNIDVLFEGADTNVYKKLSYNELPDNKLKKYLDSIPEEFCFLFVGHWLKGDIGHDRKDVGMLIKTFAQTFINAKDKPALILKTSLGRFSVREREKLKKMIHETLQSIHNPPSVYLVFGELTDDEMNQLYNHPKIKTMVSFTKGEGFGRPLLEFSLVGKPIIVSNWSGHLDFLDKEKTIFIDGELKEVHHSAVDQFILAGSKWFQVDYLDASLKMIDLKNNYENYLNKAELLRLENVEKFSLKKMNEKLCDLFYKKINLPNENKLPKLIYAS